MKKTVLFVMITICVLAFTISHVVAEKETDIIGKSSNDGVSTETKLPVSLITIDDEAFEGTALVKVELPDKVIEIGERAFADIISLHDIRIPITTSYIASTAFDGSDRTKITAPANSYARTYARTQGLPFSPIVMFCASTQTSPTSSISIDRSKEVIEFDPSTDCKPETQWRRIEEINVTTTEELIANHVQGRSPPMA